MSKHSSYRGTTIDMDSMRRENEKSPALGNAGVNAKGDKVKGGVVTKTADEMARERGRVQSVLVNSGLKGPMPSITFEAPKPPAKSTPVAATTVAETAKKPKVKEIELPSGDIVIEGDEDVNKG